jgi:hypothetical protein
LLNKAMVSISRGTAEPVPGVLLEVLDIGAAIGSRPAEQSALEVASALAWLVGDPQNAARLFGAAEAQAERTGLRRDPTDEAFLIPLIALTRAALGEAEYAAAENHGRSLTHEEATATARIWLRGRH